MQVDPGFESLPLRITTSRHLQTLQKQGIADGGFCLSQSLCQKLRQIAEDIRCNDRFPCQATNRFLAAPPILVRLGTTRRRPQ
ncbi:MAG: hypothetical protein JWP89_3383 [Schlesneria sp.]|nr:hypothetical protein [Schlesneria sp.]